MTDQTKRLEDHFKQFDHDENGTIDEREFGSLVRALGVQFSDEKVQVAFAAIDINDNGQIDFGEFSSWWRKR